MFVCFVSISRQRREVVVAALQSPLHSWTFSGLRSAVLLLVHIILLVSVSANPPPNPQSP